MNLVLQGVRTVLEYVAVVMGGAAVLTGALRGLGFLASPAPSGVIAEVFSALVVFAYRLTPAISVWPVLAWIAVGAALFVFARNTRHLPTSAAQPLLAIASIVLSAIVAGFFTPAYLTVLFTPALAFVFSQMVTAACAGLMGGVFAFLLLPRVRRETLRNPPMRLGHWIALVAWILFFVVIGGRSRYAIAKLNSVDDPNLDLIMAAWIPGQDPLQEETLIPGGQHYLSDEEVRELRAAGLTGVVKVGATGGDTDRRRRIRPRVRFVIIMSRATEETVDLAKPANDDILYIQTQTGWKRFPASAPTVDRTVRLKYFEPDAEHKLPTTRVDVDNGLGHSDSGSLPWFVSPREWGPEEWHTPLPILSEPRAAP